MKIIRWQCIAILLVLAAFQPAAAENFPPASPESQGMSAEALKELSAIVQGYTDKDQILGAELVVIKNRKTVLHEVFGWRDREDGIRMEKNTLFNLRSMTKPLTGAAAQILIDEGKLNLTAPVADYLPGFKNSKSSAITVRQILSHRSGLPLSILTSIVQMKKHGSLSAVANATGEKGPQFAPDEKFWYSDAGTEVLGALVETIAGVPLEEFVARRVLQPLGMTQTRYITGEDPDGDPSVASLYSRIGGIWKRFWKPADPPFYPYALGSQSVYGTPQDYARFLAMVMDEGGAGDGRLLSAEAVKRILTPVSPMSQLGSDKAMPTGFPGLEVYYGQMMVLYVDNTSDEPGKPPIFGHTGSDGTYAWAWPERDLMVMFFTQSRGPAIGIPLESEIENLLINPEGAAGKDEVSEELRPFLGDYNSKESAPEDKPLTVLYRNGNLALDVPGQMVFELSGPDDQGWWVFKLSADVKVSFSREESGEVGGIHIAQLIKIIQGKKTEDKEIPEDVPPEYRPWLGTYPIPMQGITLTILFQDGNLAIDDPNEGIVKLKGPDEEGLWIDQFDKNQVYFTKDAKERIHLNIIDNTRLTKVK